MLLHLVIGSPESSQARALGTTIQRCHRLLSGVWPPQIPGSLGRHLSAAWGWEADPEASARLHFLALPFFPGYIPGCSCQYRQEPTDLTLSAPISMTQATSLDAL